MNSGLLTFLLVFTQTAFLVAQIPSDLDHHPFMVRPGWDFSRVNSEEDTFTVTDDSTFVDYTVTLLKDAKHLPEAFTSSIVTPVCDDSLCAMMNIRIYWDLLGNYAGYDTVAGEPLTKNDHLEFMQNDYAKLHELLSDNNSVIKRKSKSELLDDTKTRVSEVVDAVTGATALEVKEAVVDGALYSSYTIYHIVYGPLADSIKSFTDSLYKSSLYSHGLERKLLYSARPEYQLYALKQLLPEDMDRHRDRLVELVGESIPLNRLYIMKKMPDAMWEEHQIQQRLSAYFGEMDVSSRSWFLNRLKKASQVSVDCLLSLSGSLRVMSKNQLSTFVELLRALPGKPETTLLQNIEEAISSRKLIYGYLLEDYLAGQAGK